jgi:S-adenosylmethionine:tRNA ribosyltransferase-isomerase
VGEPNTPLRSPSPTAINGSPLEGPFIRKAVLLSDFDYELPEERIAQEPPVRRDASRLLVYDRATSEIAEHARFRDLGRFLPPNSLLVLNDTRVIPARLYGTKGSGGRVEIFLVQREEASPDDTREVWRALVRASKGVREGVEIQLGPSFSAQVLDIVESGGGGTPPIRRVELRAAPGIGGVSASISRFGQIPLPPYISRQARESDRERYQTVFARREGSSAAPTAGLHFTPELLAELREQNIRAAFLTLHVGPGTFLPVREEEVLRHKMHAERFEISPETAAAVAAAKEEGRPVVAVGTTVVRTLEAAEEDGKVRPGASETRLFITPGFRFKVVDALITNFHLPRSTLLMLVAAFGGREGILAAYREAVARQYRFFSYGDAMLIR